MKAWRPLGEWFNKRFKSYWTLGEILELVVARFTFGTLFNRRLLALRGIIMHPCG